jgi:hypothetical protein
MLCPVVLVRTDVSEVRSASFIRVTTIGDLGTKPAVTSNRRTLGSSETSVLTRATGRNIPEDTVLHSHRRENLKSYTMLVLFNEMLTWERLIDFILFNDDISSGAVMCRKVRLEDLQWTREYSCAGSDRLLEANAIEFQHFSDNNSSHSIRNIMNSILSSTHITKKFITAEVESYMKGRWILVNSDAVIACYLHESIQ